LLFDFNLDHFGAAVNTNTESNIQELGTRREFLSRGDDPSGISLAEGIELLVLADESKGAINLFTGLVTMQPNARLPYHSHPSGEVIIALVGTMAVEVEGRKYVLSQYDAIHVPANCPHAVSNTSPSEICRAHVSFSTGSPERTLVGETYEVTEHQESSLSSPETLRRFLAAEIYELSPQSYFRDLFASRFGSSGICGGFGRFAPGSSLPCHTHGYDESISIIEGEAVCQAAGREYTLSNCDTACIPKGLPHRFINRSSEAMAMIWVYAGDEPDRLVVDQRECGCTET